MNPDLIETLENKVGDLLGKYSAMKDELARMTEENQRLLSEREGLKARVDAILGKLEGI
jgi:cell division protein ZapB